MDGELKFFLPKTKKRHKELNRKRKEIYLCTIDEMLIKIKWQQENSKLGFRFLPPVTIVN